MIDRKALLTDLKIQVRRLEDDLHERASEVEDFDTSLHAEWQAALDAKRLAATYESWLDERVTQSAVAWVLGTVFVRFCEDNRLIDLPYLAGPGEQLAIAAERQQAFFEKSENREKTDREWIEEGFRALSEASAVAAGLFDLSHNPMWRVTPSLDGAKTLIAFWRMRGDDGEIVHDFTDDTWNTRFLGDLYQDLSEAARKTYALLQTPEFVEEFILDLTLDSAVEEFGLDAEPPNSPIDLPNGLRLIDPTCGSGHFLLGAFKRLLRKWERQAPDAERWDLIRRALYSVHGVDKNPSAVSIARFRMLLAAMQEGGVRRLSKAPDFMLNLAVGDSLIHGRGAGGERGELDCDRVCPVHTYATEDVRKHSKSVDILGINTYHVVVGNPPYITVKDKAENAYYRGRYSTCAGTYALSVPFVQRFFKLAMRAGVDRRSAGFVGQITANSFMKREFGKKLINDFFRLEVNLTHVIDTSGAYIPGHGTPTVILAGRNMMPTINPIRAALGIRGEPKQPVDPANGLVWQAIVDQINEPGSGSEWVSVADLPSNRFEAHPWSLSGGGASDVVETLQKHSRGFIRGKVLLIGRTAHTGSDDAYFAPPGSWCRRGIDARRVAPLVEGENVRDWSLFIATEAVFPYDDQLKPALADDATTKHLWTHRASLRIRREPGGTHEEIGLTWFEWSRWHPERFQIPCGIAMAFVATHNHFALDRGGKIFKQSVPVIKLPAEASENDHLALLGVLNSSTACFWLKQVSQSKGNGGIGGGISDELWEHRFEFTGTKLEGFPLPDELPLKFGQELDSLSQRVAAVEPSAVATDDVPTRDRLDSAHYEHVSCRGRMIALQEELDWEVYRLYGLLSEQETDDLRADPDSLPELKLGERAFEILSARKMAAGEFETQWFARHGSTPITELPTHWPDAYKRVVKRRIQIIEKFPRTIGLIERPDCKRRWTSEPWEKKEKAALRNWLLDRCEDRKLWFAADDMGHAQPRPMTVNRLADRLRGDAVFVSVARLHAGSDAELADMLAKIIEGEHVPHLAALRYKDTGLRKHAQWEDTWEKQREEDATGERLDIPVPPKYTSADFLRNSYWRNRGKLDVPKERFISYPGDSPDGDGSLLLGWAGWDHREQAHALMTVIEERSTRDGWERDRLIPLIAGLAEVLPWVKQWHGEVDPAFGMSPAAVYAGYLEDQQLKHRLSAEDLLSWRPPKRGRGRKKTTNE